ncbi:MAG: flavodoxin-dependent (E)-4-hydroxy-3-methylbut-2-enyl-diphosphate synthase [Mariprofundaceae bacterium]|nr:flavodoxin-dependent (E)-4-hydroxy-3-methylbut-2-enyl-diphosphate synthase [Mariprofundaceae bacterium]
MRDSILHARRQSRQITVGNVSIGGGAAIAVQSMTNTPTTDIEATLQQIKQLHDAGADIVRVSVPDDASAEAIISIVKRSPLPIIADIHFNHDLALKALDAGVHALRLNPGNIGNRERVEKICRAAAKKGVSIRIGVNAGSLEKHLLEKYGEPCADAMVESALNHIKILEDLNFYDIKISLKASNIPMTVQAYRKLATLVDYPLHLGITESGSQFAGSIKTAIGLGLLLSEGIGDTIRVSLAADPVQEIKVGFEILKGLGLRHRGVNLIACPSCARQKFDVISIVEELEKRLSHIHENLDVAVIGCVVNGPGEAREADLGITGGYPKHLLYQDGKPAEKIMASAMIDRLVEETEVRAAKIRQQREQSE